MPHWTDEYSFSTGAVRSKEVGYLIATDDKLAKKKEPHSVLVSWYKGQWFQHLLEWSSPSVCVVQHPKEQGVVIGLQGDAFVTGQKDDHPEEIVDGKISPQKRGFLRSVRAIEGKAYAVGMHRQAYRRDGANKWTCIDDSMRPPSGKGEVEGFEAVDGFSAKEIYAAGWDGMIWSYDGKKWKELDSPTNTILTSMCCGEDGNVYICGQEGMLIRGRKNKWEIIDHGFGKADFWGVCWFNGKLYISTMKQVLTLAKDDSIERVRMGGDPAESAYHLSAADGWMWSIGAKDVMAFDGKTWSRID